MTYNQAIEKIRIRGYEWLQGTRQYEPGVVYDALHDAIRHVFFITKQHEGSSSLSLVAGTRDYTISSAIASDVDSIILITIDTGTIEPLTLRAFSDEVFFDVDDEDDITNGTPTHYRIFNGVLRVYPTPGQAFTATVYYSKKYAPDFYTTAIGATTMTLKDEFIETVIYIALAVLSEGQGEFKRAGEFRLRAREVFEETRDFRSVEGNAEIQYQDSV